MENKIGQIYECFGTFVLCSGTKQIHPMLGKTFQGIVVETDGSEGAYLGQYSDTWSSGQFKETNKEIKLKDK